MKYTGKWWDALHRTERERDVASIVVKIFYGLIIVFGLLILL